MKSTVLSRSPAETEAFAAKFAKNLLPGQLIALTGDLGAGKTVFARGVARALGIREPVTSPTFTLIQEYSVPVADSRIKRLYHLDLYRIQDAAAALAFGIDEYLEDEDALILVEWAERIQELMPENYLLVNIYHAGDDCRELKISHCF